MAPKRKPSLPALVDDYLAKHEACVQAGHVRYRVLRECESDKVKDAALQAFMEAHHARAAAFRALCDARPQFRRKPDMWDKLAKRRF